MKNKLPLVIGVGLPILLILYVAVFTYLPSLFIKPKYNLIYATGSFYRYDFTTTGGRVSLVQKSYGTNYSDAQPNLYLYDVTGDKSTPITLTKAQSYTLDPSNKSPDGFTVEKAGRGGGGFFPLFWSDSRNRGYYLQGKGLNKQISTESYNLKFVGWVLNE